MPQLGESVAEGTIGKWLKGTGERIERDEPLVEVITDKVTAEIPSPVAGVVEQIVVEEGQTVPVGREIAVITEAGASASAAAPAAEQPGGVAGMALRVSAGGLADSAGLRSAHSQRRAASNAPDRMLWMPRMVLGFIGRH